MLAGADESDGVDTEDEKEDAVRCGKATENDGVFGLLFPSAADDQAPQKEVIQEHAREGGAKNGGAPCVCCSRERQGREIAGLRASA
jgi:hypothetical protein